MLYIISIDMWWPYYMVQSLLLLNYSSHCGFFLFFFFYKKNSSFSNVNTNVNGSSHLILLAIFVFFCTLNLFGNEIRIAHLACIYCIKRMNMILQSPIIGKLRHFYYTNIHIYLVVCWLKYLPFWTII